MSVSINQSSLMIAFSVLPDPRKERNRIYSLFDLVATAILGTLCACDDYQEIADWATFHLEWLQSRDICLNGVPSRDTYERFFRHLSPKAFEKAFIHWTQMISSAVHGVVAIDGKTLRGSGGKTDDPIHMVSAFSAENKLVLGQLKTAGKGKELEGFHLILDLLDLKGTTVTIDAAGCQKSIAKQIKKKGADYVLALKENQGNFHGEVSNYFAQAMVLEPEESCSDYWCSEERTRGRTDKREVWACDSLYWLPQQEDWTGLRSIVCLKSTRSTSKGSTTQLRYYISSHEANAEHLGRAIRSHWSIENELHWHLDVTFGEDKSHVHKDHGAENLSVLRRATLNILRSDKKSKQSLKRRRKKASWDQSYLLSLLK